MHSYSSTLPVQSQVFPGVSFTLRKMSEARRTDFRLTTAQAQARLRELTREATRLAESFNKDNPVDAESAARIEDLHAEMTGVITGDLNPAYVRWGLKSIDGLTIDDQPATPELLITDGPSELFAEICGAVIAASGMGEDELKNFALPTISGAPMVDTNQSMSAASASNTDGSEARTAESISLS